MIKPVRPDSEAVTSALKFARETAEAEIAAIDRIHKRTIQYMGVFVAVFGVFGWIGYENLRKVAQTTVENEMKAEVKRQFEKDNVELVVKALIEKNLGSQLQTTVHTEVENRVREAVEKQRVEISKQLDKRLNELVDVQTKRLSDTVEQKATGIVKSMAPEIEKAVIVESTRITSYRKLSRSQFLSFRDAMAKTPGKVEVNSYGYDPEVQNFALQLSATLADAGWEAQDMPPEREGANEIVGAEIRIMNPSNPSASARSLQRALEGIGIRARITYGKARAAIVDPESWIVLVVGNKEPAGNTR